MNLRTLTIEDVAAAARLLKTTAPLVSREPCESCKDADTEADTGAFTCKASASGDPSCESYRAVRELEDIACQVAALYKRVGNKKMRESMAAHAADGYTEAFWVQGLGAEFDADAFLELAGCGRGA